MELDAAAAALLLPTGGAYDEAGAAAAAWRGVRMALRSRVRVCADAADDARLQGEAVWCAAARAAPPLVHACPLNTSCTAAALAAAGACHRHVSLLRWLVHLGQTHRQRRGIPALTWDRCCAALSRSRSGRCAATPAQAAPAAPLTWARCRLRDASLTLAKFAERSADTTQAVDGAHTRPPRTRVHARTHVSSAASFVPFNSLGCACHEAGSCASCSLSASRARLAPQAQPVWRRCLCAALTPSRACSIGRDARCRALRQRRDERLQAHPRTWRPRRSVLAIALTPARPCRWVARTPGHCPDAPLTLAPGSVPACAGSATSGCGRQGAKARRGMCCSAAVHTRACRLTSCRLPRPRTLSGVHSKPRSVRSARCMPARADGPPRCPVAPCAARPVCCAQKPFVPAAAQEAVTVVEMGLTVTWCVVARLPLQRSLTVLRRTLLALLCSPTCAARSIIDVTLCYRLRVCVCVCAQCDAGGPSERRARACGRGSRARLAGRPPRPAGRRQPAHARGLQHDRHTGAALRRPRRQT